MDYRYFKVGLSQHGNNCTVRHIVHKQFQNIDYRLFDMGLVCHTKFHSPGQQTLERCSRILNTRGLMGGGVEPKPDYQLRIKYMESHDESVIWF